MVGALILAAALAAPAPTGELAWSTGENIVAKPVAGGTVRILVRAGADPAWSPDGREIAYSCATGICVRGADGGRVRRVTRAGESTDNAPAWSPDGKRIAFYRATNVEVLRLWIANADGTRVRRLTSTQATDPAWSPRGDRIAFRDGNGRVSSITPDGRRRRLVFGASAVSTFAWAPRGHRLAFTSEQRGCLCVLHTRTRKVTRLLAVTSDTGAYNSPLAWSPDGQWLAFATSRTLTPDDPHDEQLVYDIRARAAAGTGERVVARNMAEVNRISWRR